MQPTKIETPQREHLENCNRSVRWWPSRAAWRRSIPYLYLGLALPTALLLCFLIPLMYPADEGRHFLRACQIAQGQIVSDIEPITHEAGGWLPAAAPDFVRDKMTPEYFRKQDQLHTVGQRLRALDQAAQTQAPLSEKRFAPFAGATIYPPALYLPQAVAIRFARLFSNKVYVWFYSARLLNASVAVLLIFFALRLAPAHQLALMIPAILPMSLYQISSISTDAAIIAVSILFVALCVRFLESDGALMRIALVACLLLLTTGKPVYLPFGLLLLAAYKRLGWLRAIFFSSVATAVAAGAYIAWSYLVRQFIPLAGGDFPGHNPSAQIHFTVAHPMGFASVLLNTLQWDARQIILQVIGWFSEVPLPPWFYKAAYAFAAALLLLILLNFMRNDISRIVTGALAVASILAAIFLASFVLWTPVGSMRILQLQGRYLLPVVAILAFFVPSLNQLRSVSGKVLTVLVLGFFVLSTFTTIRILNHYFFPESKLLGKTIRDLFAERSDPSCPATVSLEYHGWFSSVADGRAETRDDFRVLITNETGTILAESDPVLAGVDFPYYLLPGSSRSRWLVRFWTPNRFGTLHYWLVDGKDACIFGPELKLAPYHIPEA